MNLSLLLINLPFVFTSFSRFDGTTSGCPAVEFANENQSFEFVGITDK